MSVLYQPTRYNFILTELCQLYHHYLYPHDCKTFVLAYKERGENQSDKDIVHKERRFG